MQTSLKQTQIKVGDKVDFTRNEIPYTGIVTLIYPKRLYSHGVTLSVTVPEKKIWFILKRSEILHIHKVNK